MAAKKKVVSKKVVAKKPVSKMSTAVALFKKHYPKKKPGEIKALFVTEAGLTIAGSNTYYANIKKKHENGGL